MYLYTIVFFIIQLIFTSYAKTSLFISSKSIQGLPEAQQDYVYTAPNTDKPVIAILCDGHGPYGDFIAETVANDLEEQLNKAAFSENQNQNILIIKKAFMVINTNLKNGIGSNAKTSGSTCIVVLLIDDYFYIAHAGDCRAIWGIGQDAQTKDHTGHNKTEAERIGIANLIGPEKRVGGKLSVTRAFGDFDLVNNGITAEPDVIIIPRTQAPFIIVGSDGLWDGTSKKLTKNAAQTNDNSLIYSLFYDTVIQDNDPVEVACNRIIVAAICSTLVNRKKPLLHLFNTSKKNTLAKQITIKIGTVTEKNVLSKIDVYKKDLILSLTNASLEKFIEKHSHYAHDNTTIICIYTNHS
ncbi:protein serine/threonine phosphatase 2C family protein [Candidatus Dependentiae bacterium]|nr:MAG: protein serine/threonine phosphatase 2C family protein [Candidatus Dependentiae bacterium]